MFVAIEVGYGLVIAHPPSYPHALNVELLKFVYLILTNVMWVYRINASTDSKVTCAYKI